MVNAIYLLLAIATSLVLAQRPRECKNLPKHEILSCCPTPSTLKALLDISIRPCKPKCFRECLNKDLNIIKDRKIDIESFRSYLMTKIGGNGTWDSTIDTAVTTCAKQSIGKTGCGEIMTLALCIDFQLFMECPAGMWNSSQPCIEVLHYVKNCFPANPFSAEPQEYSSNELY